MICDENMMININNTLFLEKMFILSHKNSIINKSFVRICHFILNQQDMIENYDETQTSFKKFSRIKRTFRKTRMTKKQKQKQLKLNDFTSICLERSCNVND